MLFDTSLKLFAPRKTCVVIAQGKTGLYMPAPPLLLSNFCLHATTIKMSAIHYGNCRHRHLPHLVIPEMSRFAVDHKIKVLGKTNYYYISPYWHYNNIFLKTGNNVYCRVLTVQTQSRWAGQYLIISYKL